MKKKLLLIYLILVLVIFNQVSADDQINLLSPKRDAKLNKNPDITFTYQLSTQKTYNCSVYLNNILLDTQTNITNEPQSFIIPLEEGIYCWKIGCNNQSSKNISIWSEERCFTQEYYPFAYITKNSNETDIPCPYGYIPTQDGNCFRMEIPKKEPFAFSQLFDNLPNIGAILIPKYPIAGWIVFFAVLYFVFVILGVGSDIINLFLKNKIQEHKERKYWK